jgi:hypothetical protein
MTVEETSYDWKDYISITKMIRREELILSTVDEKLTWFLQLLDDWFGRVSYQEDCLFCTRQSRPHNRRRLLDPRVETRSDPEGRLDDREGSDSRDRLDMHVRVGRRR